MATPKCLTCDEAHEPDDRHQDAGGSPAEAMSETRSGGPWGDGPPPGFEPPPPPAPDPTPPPTPIGGGPWGDGPSSCTVDRTVFEMWLGLSESWHRDRYGSSSFVGLGSSA